MRLIVNGEDREFKDASTVQALLEALGFGQAPVVVERNGDVVERERWAATALEPGDHFEIVRFVGGG